MNEPNKLSISFILPPDDAPVCPYLPPVPVPKPIMGSGFEIHLTPCLGEPCAIYAECQGDSSFNGRERARKAALLASLNPGSGRA